MINKLLAFLLFFMVASVNATTITFEEGGTKSGLFADEIPLENQYVGLGVQFSGGWEILNQSGNFGVDAISGEHFAAFNTSVNGVTDTLEMTFDSYITNISGHLGSLYADDWIVSAFSGTNLVSSITVTNAASSYTSFALTGLLGLNIDKVTIQGSALYGVLEDLTFNASPVPIPAAVWLFGSGLLGLFGFSKHRKAVV